MQKKISVNLEKISTIQEFNGDYNSYRFIEYIKSFLKLEITTVAILQKSNSYLFLTANSLTVADRKMFEIIKYNHFFIIIIF